MRLWKFVSALILFVFLSFTAHGETPSCMVSFDGAKLDVCSGQWDFVNDDLRYLADEAVFGDAGIRIVKFDRPVGAGQRAALEEIGAEVLGYVPYYGYKVRMSAQRDDQARAIENVIWVGPYYPVWKIGTNLANELHDGRFSESPDLNQLHVTLHRGVQASLAEAFLESIAGLETVATGSVPDHDYAIVAFDRSRVGNIVEDLAVNPDIDAISIRFPNELLNSQGVWLHQSGEGDPAQTPLFDQGLFGCGQTIGFLDSGLAHTHCSFEDPDPDNDFPFDNCTDGPGCQSIPETDEHRKIGAFYNWHTQSSTPGDVGNHGTAVVGNAIGSNWNDPAVCEDLSSPGGLTDLDGMAPGARAIMQEAATNLEYLNTLGGNLYHAAVTAFDNGAFIHNNSWGGGCRGLFGCVADCIVEYRENSRFGDMAVWENPELFIFAAAGNSGGGDGNPGCGLGADVGSPGNAKNVFGIGGNQRGASGNNTYMSSSRGPASDRRTKPDIIAQSQAVQTSNSASSCGARSATGTSFGSPTAAGFGALVREYLQRGFYPLGIETEVNAIDAPSAALMRAIMTNSAVAITGTGSGSGFPNQNIGWGRLLADNALYFDGDDRRLWLHDEKDGLQTDETHSYEVSTGDEQELIVTLIWHDYFAELNADPHIVNMLRLEVEAPNGDVWTQKLTPGGGLADANPFQGTSEDDYDDRNTVHQIVIDSPEAGTYQVRVVGIQVAMGDAQPYAVVATGDLLGIGDPDFILQRSPASQAVCSAEDADFEIGVFSVSEFEDPVTLSVTDGLPAGASADFSVNPITPADPPASSILTISDTDLVAAGTYEIEVTGESSGPEFDPVTKTILMSLTVDEDLSGPTLLQPADGAIGVVLRPNVQWEPVAGAVEYEFQIDTDSAFGDPLSLTVEDSELTPDFDLDTGTDYFWRVRAINACGDGEWSETFEFQTRFQPVAELDPGSFEFEVTLGDTDSQNLDISNTGTGSLVWSIELDEPESGGNELRFGGVFAPENWTLVNEPAGVSGSVNIEDGPPVEVFVVGGNADVGGYTDFEIEIPASGVVTFDWGYQSEDVGCFDSGGYAVNGEFFELACNSAPVPFFNETISVDVEAGDLFAFRVETDDGQFGAGTFGVSNFDFVGSVCEAPGGVPWLSVDPDNGSVTAGSSQSVNVMVDTADLADGFYEGALCVETNAQNQELLTVPVSLRVVDPNLALVEGSVASLGVCSDEIGPLEGAVITVEGVDNTFITESDADGVFALQVSIDENPVDITVSAPFHADETETGVTLVGGETNNFDFSLAGDSACAEVTPTSIEESAGLGATAQATIEISSIGEQALDWVIGYTDGGGPAGRIGQRPAASGGLISGDIETPSRQDEELGVQGARVASEARGSSLFQGAARQALIDEGVLLMPDSGNDRVVAMDPETGDILDLNFFEILDVGVPVQVILHPDGQRFLLTRQSGNAGGVVEEYDLDGEFTGIFAPVGGQDTSIMQNIRGLAVHPATGNILVTVSGVAATVPENSDAVLEFDQNGELLGRFIESGAGGLSGPWSIVFRDNDVIVSDSGGDALRVYDWDGEFIEVFTEDPNFPQQITQGPAGTILAAGFSNPSGAWEWDADGEQIGQYGPETGLRGIHELPNGNILVTNSPGIHEIDRNGDLVRTLETDVTGRFITLVQGELSCDPVAPGWLSVDQDSGSTDPGLSDTITATLDTDGLQLGQYSAQVCVESNDPVNPVIPVDVTFNVELGDDFGIVEGTVSSLGFCGEEGFPAAGAQVELVGSSQTFTVTADDNGFYEALVPVDDGPYDVTASAPDHFSETETSVVVSGGDTSIVDFNLAADVPCIEVDPLTISAQIETGGSGSDSFDISNTGTADLEWLIDTSDRSARASDPLVGFNFTTAGATPPDPQNWTRISAADGVIENAPDDTGEPTGINFEWGGVSTDGPIYLGTASLGANAVPQHDYDLSGMTGYGFRSGGEFFIELTGLQPNSTYEYWMVAYRSVSAIDNIVTVSEGEDPGAIQFNQFLAAGDNDGRFVINETNANGDLVWDELSFITQSDSDGSIRITWEGDSQTTVIGAFAIRSAVSCDIPDWLSVNPDAGTLADGASETVVASFDGTGLAPGDYEAAICVESNDPTTPVEPVTIDLNVVLPADVATLEGQVQSLGYCNENPELVEGASVTVTSADETFTTTTDENGFYQFFIQEGESPVDLEVTAPEHIAGLETGVMFIGGDVVVTDFDLLLEAPCATVDPDSFLFQLSDDETETQTLTLGNLEGNADLDWIADLEPATDSRSHFPEMPRLAGFPSVGEVSAGLDPDSRFVATQPGAVLLQDFDVPAYSTTGFAVVGYIGMDALVPGDLTVIDPDQPTTVFAGTFVGDDMSQQYMLSSDGGSLSAGTMITVDVETGDVVELGQVTGGLGAMEAWNSMAWDPSTGNIIGLQGGDTLFEIDLDTLEATEVGVISGPDVSGLTVAIALAPDGLLYGLNITDNVLLAIDKQNADAAVIGDLGFNPNFAQDMDFDPTDGTLYWAGYFGGGDSRMMTIDLDTGAATEIGAIEGGSELLAFAIALPRISGCEDPGDVSWLDINPTGGTTEAGTSTQIDVMASASDQEVGTLQANICLSTNDSQQAQIIIPVTLDVGLPMGSGAIEGVVQSLGYCSADPTLVEGAVVTVTGQNETFTTTTDENGFYSIVIDVDESPVDVEVTAPDHLPGVEQNVDVESGVTTNLDFDLLLDSACATVDPESFSFDLSPDDTGSDTLTIGNINGASQLTWGIETADSASRDSTTLSLTRSGRPALSGDSEGRAGSLVELAEYTQQLEITPTGSVITVLVVSPDGYFGDPIPPNNLVDDLNAFPNVFAELYDEPALSSITVADLEDFDVVVTTNNNRWSDAGADVAVGDALADYVDLGGKVILHNFAYDFFGFQMAGRFITENYGPITLSTSDVQAPSQMVVVEAGHPVFDNVGSIGYGNNFRLTGSSLTPGAQLLAEWDDGVPMIAINDDSLSINAMYSSDGDQGDWTGDLNVLVYNAVVVLAGDNGEPPLSCENPADVTWLSVDPESGSTDAGETSEVNVMVDAAGLAVGDYNALLCVSTNDPVADLVEVPVSLSVAGVGDTATLQGTVQSQGYCSAEPFPAAGANVVIEGQLDTYTVTADQDGFYSIELDVGESPADITASAPDHISQTEFDISFGAGETVTVDFDLVLEAPCATVDPEAISVTLFEGSILDDLLVIGNVDGGAALDWTITQEPRALSGELLARFEGHEAFRGAFNPDLDEPLGVPDFTVVSPENGGSAVEFQIEAGLASSGNVIGFTFEGTVTGVTGNSTWASDLRLLLTSPTGETFDVGGLTEVANEWEFAGIGSTEDGTYVSVHLEADDGSPVFGEGGTPDAGDWSLSFTHDWDSELAADMDWSDVTLILHKTGDGGPEGCEAPDDVPWLDIFPNGGVTEPGEESDVLIRLNTTALASGQYAALMCIESNDPENSLIPVPVSLRVSSDVLFSDRFEESPGREDKIELQERNPN